MVGESTLNARKCYPLLLGLPGARRCCCNDVLNAELPEQMPWCRRQPCVGNAVVEAGVVCHGSQHQALLVHQVIKGPQHLKIQVCIQPCSMHIMLFNVFVKQCAVSPIPGIRAVLWQWPSLSFMPFILTPIMMHVQDPCGVCTHDVLREAIICLQQPRVVLLDEISVSFIRPKLVFPGRVHCSANKLLDLCEDVKAQTLSHRCQITTICCRFRRINQYTNCEEQVCTTSKSRSYLMNGKEKPLSITGFDTIVPPHCVLPSFKAGRQNFLLPGLMDNFRNPAAAYIEGGSKSDTT